MKALHPDPRSPLECLLDGSLADVAALTGRDTFRDSEAVITTAWWVAQLARKLCLAETALTDENLVGRERLFWPIGESHQVGRIDCPITTSTGMRRFQFYGVDPIETIAERKYHLGVACTYEEGRPGVYSFWKGQRVIQVIGSTSLSRHSEPHSFS